MQIQQSTIRELFARDFNLKRGETPDYICVSAESRLAPRVIVASSNLRRVVYYASKTDLHGSDIN